MTRRCACLVCGDPMEAVRVTRRYCSIRCRVKASREFLSVTGDPGMVTDTTPTPSAPPATKEPPPAAIQRPRLPLPIEVRHVPGERLVNGSPSGKGGRTTYHVAGRSFGTPREALDFASR
jgi:hypothetical protein